VKLPKFIVVGKILTSRYANGVRPQSWDQRSSGIEEIESVDGVRFVLNSEGGQSTPQPGWKIMLLSEHSEGAYSWTLQGINLG
jgi:hypothetical protein